MTFSISSHSFLRKHQIYTLSVADKLLNVLKLLLSKIGHAEWKFLVEV